MNCFSFRAQSNLSVKNVKFRYSFIPLLCCAFPLTDGTKCDCLCFWWFDRTTPYFQSVASFKHTLFLSKNPLQNIKGKFLFLLYIYTHVAGTLWESIFTTTTLYYQGIHCVHLICLIFKYISSLMDWYQMGLSVSIWIAVSFSVENRDTAENRIRV